MKAADRQGEPKVQDYGHISEHLRSVVFSDALPSSLLFVLNPSLDPNVQWNEQALDVCNSLTMSLLLELRHSMFQTLQQPLLHGPTKQVQSPTFVTHILLLGETRACRLLDFF